MPNFNPGDFVGVPCTIEPGASLEENLITIETVEGRISGFVQKKYLIEEHKNRGKVRGKIIKVQNDQITVQLPGSFFTTATGIASVTSDWARNNFDPVFAA